MSTPNSGNAVGLPTTSSAEELFKTAKMQSTEPNEGLEESQGPDFVTLRLDVLVSWPALSLSSLMYSVISSISSSIWKGIIKKNV